MNDTIPNYNRQTLTVKNDFVTVELLFERGENLKETQSKFDKIIELNEIKNWTSSLELKINFTDQPTKTCLITGIDGGLYLHTADDKDNSYSVKLEDNFLIFSLGFTFFSFDTLSQEIIWKVRPDMAEVFEFYDLQDDFLLRGELEIHRIDKNGNIKWSYGGRDIWVNIDGKTEVIIETEKIILTDFDSNEYIIDFEGKTIEDKPRQIKQYIKTSKWWKFW